jgi:hypothetical protein
MQKKQKKEWKKPEVMDLDGKETSYTTSATLTDGTTTNATQS